MVTVDNSEFSAYAADLERAARDLPKEIRGVVSKGALNIKNQMNKDLAHSTHFGGVAGSVSYDLRGSGATVEAEIGPEKGAPGSLANVAFFGTSRGGGTVADPAIALNDEAPRFHKALEDLMAKALQ